MAGTRWGVAGAEASPLGPEAHGKGFRFCSKGSGQPLGGLKQAVSFLSPRLITQRLNKPLEMW